MSTAVSQPQVDVTLQVILLLVPAVALLVNAAAFFLNAYQARRTNRVARANLVASGLKDFMNDPEIQEAFYLIEYNKFRYDSAFQGSDTERRIDKLLRLLSNLALLWQDGVLTTRDLSPLRYYYIRIFNNEGIRHYLAFLKEWTDRLKIQSHPYESFARLATTLQGK